ncbi:MCAT, partial [Symbiodinium sp. CCMP2456]
ADKEPPRLQALRSEVRTGVHAQQWSNMDALEDGIFDIACKHYSLEPKPAAQVEATQELANCARQMWALFRDMRSHSFTAAGVFEAWQQWAKFTQAHREHKQRSKNRSKAWKLELLQQAQQAAKVGDMHKAVPAEAAPSVIWRACSSEVAQFISAQINQQWQQEHLMVPQRWADASVALLPLPKPKNKNDTPADWRPIGLQHPIGKSIMRIVISQAKDQIHRLVQEWPQCVYVPQRSTITALKRVYQHCFRVREAGSQHRLTLHQKQEGLEQIPNSGGLQVSMDLSAAFDLVPWHAIKEAMELAEVDPSVQELLLQWLGQVRYKFQHKGLEKEIWPSWGLRQGCIGSPILWAAFTALLGKAIDTRIQANRSTLRIGCIQDRRMGMKVNNSKTQAIMSLTGDPTTWILLVDKAEYLGPSTKVGYGLHTPYKTDVSIFNTLMQIFTDNCRKQPNALSTNEPLLAALATIAAVFTRPMYTMDEEMDAFFGSVQEELRILRQDTAFILFLKPGQDSIMHHLYQTAVTFKAKQEAEPQWQLGQMPLRMVLAIALFKEVTDRLNNTLASQEKLKRATVDKARPPIPDDQKMTETMSSAATYKMDLSLRSHSAVTMWDTVKMLQGNAVFQLAGMAYKTDSLARSPAEQKIMDMLYGRRG